MGEARKTRQQEVLLLRFYLGLPTLMLITAAVGADMFIREQLIHCPQYHI
jgi:hypothetical protein